MKKMKMCDYLPFGDEYLVKKSGKNIKKSASCVHFCVLEVSRFAILPHVAQKGPNHLTLKDYISVKKIAFSIL